MVKGDWIRAAIENFMLERLVPLEGPGWFFRWFFKAPLVFYRLGWYRWVPGHILILTTVGRKSGRPRRTPVEYGYDPATNTFSIMAGWMGKTDWYRNARANPHVCIQIGPRVIPALAEPMSEDAVTRVLVETTRLNPGALKIWSRWANRPLEPTEKSLRQAAPYFPSLLLRPE